MSAFLLMTALYPVFIFGEKVVKTVGLAGKQMILSAWLILVLRIGRNWISANHLPLIMKTNICCLTIPFISLHLPLHPAQRCTVSITAASASAAHCYLWLLPPPFSQPVCAGHSQ